MLICDDGSPDQGRPSVLPPDAPTVTVPSRPGKADVDPLLDASALGRLVVVGADADLAAVLVRLLRRGRLDVELGYVATGRSAAVRAWGLPAGAAAVALALSGAATPVPLARDDAGGVLVGRAEVRDLRGECYADDVLVLRGHARRLVVEAGQDGVGVRASRLGTRPDGRTRAVGARAPAGRGSATARAVQLGGAPFVPVLDGVAHPRSVRRWAWYRHTDDWLLVLPDRG